MTQTVAPRFSSSLLSWSRQPVGRLGVAILGVAIVSAPWLLFFDPIGLPRQAHLARDPISIYRIYSDDFAYIAASRNLERTLWNLFVPHNTHIVPAWRVLTWALVAWAGSLEKIPEVLAEAAYGILVAVMLLLGRVVARETGRTSLGLAAMAAMGTTSVIAPSACWYSAGQTLWAGFGILAALWYAQCWRRSRSFAALALSAVSAMLAGWFWTIGHIAGPAAALYLWLDGRPKWRWGALAPLAGSVLAVALGMFLGGGKIDSTVSFHGRTTSEAARPIEGFLHTAQAIPENLILGNLGLKTKTTQSQGLTLTLVLAGIWFLRRWRQGGLRAFNPLECTGTAVVLGSYFVEWTVRGYFPFRLLRTISMGMIVPWYDTVPQIGAVLFVAGWLAGPHGRESKPSLLRPIRPLSRAGAIGICGLLLVMIVLNRPRIDVLWRGSVPPLIPYEKIHKLWPIVSLQSMRATTLLFDRAQWQRRHLRRLDQAQVVAGRLGIGRETVHSVFGRLDMPELPKVYDAADLLDLPERGRPVDPEVVRRALLPYVFKEPEPRPAWLPVTESWPPPPEPDWTLLEVDAGD